jgi:hypothetical protein
MFDLNSMEKVMASKENAVYVADKNAYQIQYVDSKGDTKVRDTVPMVHVMSEDKAVDVLQGYAKDTQNQREAAVSLITRIMTTAGDSLNAYKGAVKGTEALPQELKASMQGSEEAYFKRYMDPKHPHHKAFTSRLPKTNARGEALEVGGKLNTERQFQYFLTATRQNPSYSNAKNIVLSFWAYCGQSPLSEDGKSLIPPEVMRVMVAQVRTVQTKDNSVKARLWEIRREIMAESKNPPDDDMPEIVATLRDLLGHCETLATAAATRARAKMKPGDVVTQTKDAITAANQKQPAAAPTDGKVQKATA